MSKVDELKQDIVKTREDLKVIFEGADENGKYTADQKESIAKANTLLAEQVDDLKLEEAKEKNENKRLRCRYSFWRYDGGFGGPKASHKPAADFLAL